MDNTSYKYGDDIPTNITFNDFDTIIKNTKKGTHLIEIIASDADNRKFIFGECYCLNKVNTWKYLIEQNKLNFQII